MWLEDRAQDLDFRLSGIGGGVARGQALEHGAHLEDLHRLPRLDAPYAGATVAVVLDQALLLEAGQRGANRPAAHGHPPGQLAFNQPLAGLELPVDDPQPQ